MSGKGIAEVPDMPSYYHQPTDIWRRSLTKDVLSVPLLSPLSVRKRMFRLRVPPTSSGIITLYSRLKTTWALPSLVEREAPVNRIKRERLAFEEMKNDLLKDEKLRGGFVAIFRERVVDHDKNNRELANRVYKKYGYVPIYIDQVERKRKVVEIPSPELR